MTTADTAFWVGKTFDDFLFRPQKGMTGSRRHINLATVLTDRISLELPIVSSNMDSVTGADMARAMAMEGGIGVIHRAMTIERQARKVAQIKRSQSAVINQPLCLPLGTTIQQARNFAHNHSITGILIETEPGSNILAGLLSQRDMPWNSDHDDQPVERFMTPFERLVVDKPGISIEQASKILFEHRIERLPLVDKGRHIHGLITRRDIFSLRERPYSSKDDNGHLLVAAAIGARGDYLDRSAALLEAGVDCLFIDIAHGHSMVMEEAVSKFRGRFGHVPLVCGNVATAEGARFMRDIGADAVKVGVGPGRGCRTRLETAAGVPQLQAIRETWKALGDSIPIIADGGIKTDKDIFLALVCGATTVMLGSALSGTDEAPGRVIEDPGTHTKKKIYRGMTSPEAVLESLYDPDNAEATDAALDTPPEGQEIQVPYKGSVNDILHRVRGHLRSSVSYAGEATLQAARAKILNNPEKYLIPLSESSRRESYER
jgi:IMP dehydrogenase